MRYEPWIFDNFKKLISEILRIDTGNSDSWNIGLIKDCTKKFRKAALICISRVLRSSSGKVDPGDHDLLSALSFYFPDLVYDFSKWAVSMRSSFENCEAERAVIIASILDDDVVFGSELLVWGCES